MPACIYLHMIARYSYEYVHPTLHCVLKKGTLGQLRFINASKLNAFTRSLYRSTKSKLNFSTQDRVAITQACGVGGEFVLHWYGAFSSFLFSITATFLTW
jgi:hypothetical protein